MACSQAVMDTAQVREFATHCLSGTMALGIDSPECCWQKRFPKVGRDALVTLRPVWRKNTVTIRNIEAKVAIVEALAVAAEQGDADANIMRQLNERFGASIVGRVCAAIPDGSPLLPPVAAFRREKKREARNKGRPESVNRSTAEKYQLTSPEFLEALRYWGETYQVRGERKAKYGNAYKMRTLKIIMQSAERFCAYLEQEEIFRWVDVAQRHIDGYIEATNRHAAQKACTFLRFVTKRFRIKSTFKRPRNELSKISPRVLPADEVNRLLDEALALHGTEVAVAFSFIAIYAQTLVAVQALTMDAIQQTEGGYQVRFNEVWIPMDEQTGTLLAKYLEERSRALQEGDGRDNPNHLILNKPWRLEYLMSRLTKGRLKDIRLTALISIMQTGFRDRRALELSLGVSLQTIVNIERLCGWDFQSSVSDEAAELRRDLIDGKLADR